MVEKIKSFPTYLQVVVLGPRHLPGLDQGRVEVPETRSTQDISGPDFAVAWEPKYTRVRGRIIEHCQWIIEELNGSICRVVNVYRQSANVTGGISSRAVEVEAYRECGSRRAERHSTASSENTGEFPTTDNLVRPAGNTTTEPASTAKRQLINEVRIDEVTDVEIRIASANSEVGQVANESARDGVNDTRSVID